MSIVIRFEAWTTWEDSRMQSSGKQTGTLQSRLQHYTMKKRPRKKKKCYQG